MKTSLGIMSLLGKPEWRWRSWSWTRRKTSTCASRELSPWVKLNCIQTTLCSPRLKLLLTCCNLTDKENCNSRGSQRHRCIRRWGNAFLICMHVWTWQIPSEVLANIIIYHTKLSIPSAHSQGKRGGRWRSVAGSWSPSCTAHSRAVSSWALCAAFTWPPWMLMATLTLMSKCR